MRIGPFSAAACLAGATALLAAAAAGGGDPPTPAWDLPRSEADVVRSLADVAHRFGPDAVLMQTYLLNEAARNGSVLEATALAPALETRNGRRYLVFVLDSGIVFNDRSLSAGQRLRRVWQDIIARCLWRFTSLTLPAEGLGVHVRYHHKAYADEAALRASLASEGRGEAETAAFYFATADVEALVAKALTSGDLLARSESLLNGVRRPVPRAE